MLDAMGDDVLLDDLEERKEEERSAEPEHGHHHTHETTGPPKPPAGMRFNDSASMWTNWSHAFDVTNRLNPGEGAHMMDLGALGIVPASGAGTPARPAPDLAMLLYLRAFSGPKLAATPIQLRLDLFSAPDANEPAATTEMTSGALGMQLFQPNSGTPVFETPEDVSRRWQERTRRILSNRSGTEYFAATNGRPRGKGTRESPWDLQTALTARSIKPGDTLWIRGGLYEAPGHRMQAPPSAQPENDDKTAPPPKLEGGLDVAGDDEDPLSEFIEDLDDPQREIEREKKEAEKFVTRHYFTCNLSGTSDQPVIVRQLPGEQVVIRGGLKTKGAHTWFWGFEVSEPPERANSHRDSSHFSCGTIGARLINLHLHGGDKGLNLSGTSQFDTEIYGCIVHDFGYPHLVPATTAHYLPQVGVGMSPGGGVWRITDNVVFHGHGIGLMVPTWSEGLHGLTLEGNVLFAAGAKQNGWTIQNLQLNWHDPSSRISMIDNILHQPTDRADNLQSIGYTPLMGTQSFELELRGNIFDGGGIAANLGTWTSFRVTANTFRTRGILASLIPSRDLPDARHWDRNTYVALREAPEAGSKDGDHLFVLWGPQPTFDEWRAPRRFDGESTIMYSPDSLTRPPIVSVRPNSYEPGRGHIAVVGWGEAESVDVDLSNVLNAGDAFSIFSVQELSNPVTTASYDGNPVRVTRTRSELTPDFDAYLVVATKRE